MLHYAHKHFLILHAHKRTAENEKRKKLDNVKVWGHDWEPVSGGPHVQRDANAVPQL